jgi:myosin heavy subunit
LARHIINEQIGDFGKDYYALGNTKIFMKNEIFAVLEEARTRAVFILITLIFSAFFQN